MSITEDQFRKTLGLFPTGVTVVTVSDGVSKDRGITISSFTSVSLNPPQVLFCLSKQSKTMAAFKASPYFAVNILRATQHHLSEGFAKHIPLEWDTLKTHRHEPTRCLLISEALGHVICEKAALYEGGDHEIILGKVIDAIFKPDDLPLIRQRGKYSTIQPLQRETISELDHRKTGSF